MVAGAASPHDVDDRVRVAFGGHPFRPRRANRGSARAGVGGPLGDRDFEPERQHLASADATRVSFSSGEAPAGRTMTTFAASARAAQSDERAARTGV